MGNIPESAGLSSFNLLDQEAFFHALDIKSGMTILDLGCGLGNYAITFSQYVGETGLIQGFDLWEEGIEILNTRAAVAQITNIRADVVDVCKKIPIEDQCVDLCLLATVVHNLIHEKNIQNVLTEVRRVLKPGGVIAIVEFKKMGGPAAGPPLSQRHSPLELEKILASHNLHMIKSLDVGQYNYLSIFSVVS